MLGELKIQGNGRTKDKVIRREAVMAGLLPGEVLDKNRIEIFRRRLMKLGYFMNDPNQGKQIKIEIANRRPKDKPYGDLMMPLIGGSVRRRGCKTRARARISCRRPNRSRLPSRRRGDDRRAQSPGADAVRQRPVQPAGQYDAVDRRARASAIDARTGPDRRRTARPPIPRRLPSAPASRRHRFPASPA